MDPWRMFIYLCLLETDLSEITLPYTYILFKFPVIQHLGIMLMLFKRKRVWYPRSGIGIKFY